MNFMKYMPMLPAIWRGQEAACGETITRIGHFHGEFSFTHHDQAIEGLCERTEYVPQL